MEDAGATKMLLLEDKWSVKGEGMGVLVLDLILTYGIQAATAFDDEESGRELLVGVGRGSALSVGTNIESERFTTVKGILAYEAVVDTNIPGIKVKQLWLMRPGYMVGILMMADANAFQDKIGEYERIIQGDWLQIVN